MSPGRTPHKEDLEKAIEDLLAGDIAVDSSNITVEVDRDTAILSGSVPRYGDRLSAEIDALYAPGIQKVVNNLSIRSPAGEDRAADDLIRSEIELSLARNPGTDGADIAIAVKHGIATLTGTVDEHWKKLRAAELAAETPGVVAVNNKLAIVGFEDIDDESIAEQVLDRLSRKGIDVNAIDIEVTAGKVVLSGAVPSRGIVERAERLAKAVPGVTEVQNELIVI